MNSEVYILKNLSDEDYCEIADNYTSATEYLKDINFCVNSRNLKIISDKVKELNLEYRPRFIKLQKVCPVCDKKFEVIPSEDKVTCGYSCSNTYFRSKESNPNWKGTRYQTICWQYHEKKCVICGEDNIVAVHHFDENHDNNSPENLVPLCPTHHNYMHSRYKELIMQQVKDYVSHFKLGRIIG